MRRGILGAAVAALAIVGVLGWTVATAEEAPAVVIVPGDHSLRPASKDKAETAENVKLAVDALVLWARRWVQ